MPEFDQPTSALLTHRLATLHDDVGELKKAMTDLASAMTKLALIEERQANAAAAQERAFAILERLEQRVASLELQAPAARRINAWFERGLWAGAGLIVMLFVKKVGLL